MLLVLALAVAAVAPASEKPVLSRGFMYFYNLEYDEAIREFRREVALRPEDPHAHNHVAQGVLYREMLNAGALESEMVTRTNPFLRRPNMKPSAEAVRLFDLHVRRALELTSARIERNAGDTGALYAQGVAYGLRANYNFLVRKAWLDSLRDATTARKLHNRVSELEPDNVDARLVQGLHDYLVGSLPWHYKLLGFLTGIRGDREQGIATLRYVGEHGTANRYDAQVLLAAIYRREKEPELAVPLLRNLIAEFPRNYLLHIELALMHQDLGQNDIAISILDALADRKRKSPNRLRTLPIEKVHYYKGTVYFWAHEVDKALQEFERVTPQADSLDLNTAILAWMRTGQIHDLKGNRERARAAYEKAIALAPDSAPARESRGYLRSPYRGT